jgi:hypothetical protein
MQRRHDLRTLTHRRSDAFDRARTDIPDGEDARATCLQQAAIAVSLRASQHESFGIERHAGSNESVRVRICSDEEEQVVDGPAHFHSRRALPPADRLQQQRTEPASVFF